MTKKNYCPECEASLSAKSKRCVCGWVSGEPRTADYRCQFAINSKRCPLPGAICSYAYSNGPWYCADHWQAIGDPKLAEAALLKAEEEYESILAERKDWRKKLIPKI